MTNRLSSVKDYYELSRLWSDYYAVTGAEVAAIKNLVGDLSSFDILEVGSGNGRFTKQIAPLCRSISGVDNDASLIETASKLFEQEGLKNARFFTADSEKLPFAESSFDLVLMPWMLHMVKDRTKAISEACRVLRPQGQLLVFALLPDCDYDRVACHFVPALDRKIDPDLYYLAPIKEAFGAVRSEKLPEDEHSFCFLFPNCAVAGEAFNFAFEHWYDCRLNQRDKDKLRHLLQGFAYGDQIRLQTRGLLLSAVK
ncbi:MAG: class I SAM-dependent methyltransferase [Candidatus Obscuribacterales bacterium]|nr:class I SAM-dependent methyltransferase [Candidatus Obscuribacterales bacterium]